MDSLTRLLKQSIENERNKRAARLTDFSQDELTFAYVAIEDAQQAAEYALAQHAKIGTDAEHETVKFWEKRLAIATLWKGEIMKAKVNNGMETITESN